MISKLVVFACLLAFAHSARIGYPAPLFGGRVVGGHNAEIGEFPHQVSLQWGVPPSLPFKHFCGGSILNERWILTAAHCVNAVSSYGIFAIKAGKHKIHSIENNEQLVEVENSIVHKDYEGNVGPYDIALLKLKTSLKFNKYVSPISLPQLNSKTIGSVTLSGWGSTSKFNFPIYPEILQTVELSVIDLQTCNASLLQFAKYSPLHETNLCTGPLTGGFSACSGDSGGPLITDNNGHRELVGVVSWGIIPCGTPRAPSIFVKVSSFLEWIKENMSQ